MEMTSQQKYSVLLEEIGALLQEKNTTISCQKWQIDELKAKLEDAEAERDLAEEKLADAGIKISLLLEENHKLKGGAA